MIDFHSHIIYGVDDGSKDIDMSLDMIKNAEKEGTKYICATSHYLSGEYEPDREEYFNKLKELREKSNIHIISGLEVYMDPSLPDLYKEKKIWGINEGPYMLIEFPMRDVPKYSMDVLYELTVLGIKPIIAHPERNIKLINNIHMIEDFIEEGYLLQLNANSLLGKHGQAEKAFGEELVKRNMIHLVGSDGHNNSFRKTDIKEALKILEELNPELHGFILENEHKVLEGLDIHIPDIKELKEKKKGFFGLFKRK